MPCIVCVCSCHSFSEGIQYQCQDFKTGFKKHVQISTAYDEIPVEEQPQTLCQVQTQLQEISWWWIQTSWDPHEMVM